MRALDDFRFAFAKLKPVTTRASDYRPSSRKWIRNYNTLTTARTTNVNNNNIGSIACAQIYGDSMHKCARQHVCCVWQNAFARSAMHNTNAN